MLHSPTMEREPLCRIDLSDEYMSAEWFPEQLQSFGRFERKAWPSARTDFP